MVLDVSLSRLSIPIDSKILPLSIGYNIPWSSSHPSCSPKNRFHFHSSSDNITIAWIEQSRNDPAEDELLQWLAFKLFAEVVYSM